MALIKVTDLAYGRLRAPDRSRTAATRGDDVRTTIVDGELLEPQLTEVAEHTDALPAACTEVIEVTAGGTCRSRRVDDGHRTGSGASAV